MRRGDDDNRSGRARARVDRLALLRNVAVALGAAAAIATWLAPSLYSWAYVFAGVRDYRVDIVAHPIGYTGGGGTLRVTVGIDPTSPHAREMVAVGTEHRSHFQRSQAEHRQPRAGRRQQRAGELPRLRVGRVARSRARTRSCPSECRLGIRSVS